MPQDRAVFAPIQFIYTHLHNAIRSELDQLGANVHSLEPAVCNGTSVVETLTTLKKKYTFLSHIYKYHSYVEDEVVYPALDCKVRNVTLAYRVEHEDEERLFDQLVVLCSHALAQPADALGSAIRELVCKVGEVHTTLRKHLRKEEEQLLPLLLQHFSNNEQAQLIAQSLCCIPLAMVSVVLSWMKRSMPITEQQQLLAQVQTAMSHDQALVKLLIAWLSIHTHFNDDDAHIQVEARKQASSLQQPQLSPAAASGEVQPAVEGVQLASVLAPAQGFLPHKRKAASEQLPGVLPSITEDHLPACNGATSPQLAFQPLAESQLNGAKRRAVESGAAVPAVVAVLAVKASAGDKPPLRDILYLHEAIRGALEAFVADAQALTQQGTVTSSQLSALVEKHRFLRAVCSCHSASEEEFLFPAARQLSRCPSDAESNTVGLPELCDECEEEHAEEASLFEGLGRLLGDVKASTRRGAREAAALTEELCRSALAVRDAIGLHLRKEERQVLPVLESHLEPHQQRVMVWQSLRAMPLRLLERVLPWMAGGQAASAGTLTESEVSDLVNNMRLAAPLEEAALVELLSRWTHNAAQDGQTYGQHVVATGHGPDEGVQLLQQGDAEELSIDPVSCKVLESTTAAATSSSTQLPVHSSLAGAASVTCELIARAVTTDAPLKPQSSSSHVPKGAEPVAGTVPLSMIPSEGSLGPPRPSDATIVRPSHNISQPIDHIFQFHKALRRELKTLESAAMALDTAVLNAQAWSFDAAVQDLEGRFTFLWGIYQAHSKAEDEIVFPALEDKEATHNISHAYTLDHQQEGQYFSQVEALFQQIRGTSDFEAQRSCVSQLRRMCAAIRASLETHVRAEENELWPVFVEHFTVDEQQALVGQIIGRTGAEVLQAMLPWVTGSFTAEEEEAMMSSLRSATKNTMFNNWLDAVGSRSRMEVRTGSGHLLSSHAAAADGNGVNRVDSPAASPRAQAAHMAGARSGSLPADAALDPLVLRDMARYLRDQQQGAPGGSPETSGVVKDTREYRPGWDDIFRMNEQQLQGAIRRVCGDPNLEPARKSYIVQHIMTSRFIAAQQRRMAAMYGIHASAEDGASPAASDSAGRAAAPEPATAAGATSSRLGVHGAAEQNSQHTAQQARSSCEPSCPHRASDPQEAARPGAGPGMVAAVHGGQNTAGEAALGGSMPHVTYHNIVSRTLGCKHYKRAAKLVAPCCGREFTCRLCHDECVTDHKMDRYSVAEMRCMYCSHRQPVAASCSSCSRALAKYYCDICHLFDNEDGRDIYHCPFCNVCRRGKGLGVDFFHCMTCNSCMSLELHKKHSCREKSLECTCPVCSDYLFDSNLTVKELPCGHFMHSTCFAAYTRHSYTCPVCSRSLGDMRVYWRMLDSLIEAERHTLPPAYACRTQTILCNDCGQNGKAPFHFVYHRCPNCNSYNTRLTA